MRRIAATRSGQRWGLEIGGTVVLVIGVGLIYMPAAFMVAGGYAIIVANWGGD